MSVRGVHVFTCLALLVGLLTFVAPRVTRAADGVVGDGSPSSCTQAALVEELAAGGAITFACGGAVVIPVTNQINVATDASLSGAGLVTLDGETNLEPFETTSMLVVAENVTLELHELSLVNGSSAGNGGTIYNAGTLELADSRISDSTASLPGGAIYNAPSGTLDIDGSVFERNSSPDQQGGAIANDGIATFTDSTFDTNTALFGGAISNHGTLSVTDSTVEGNNSSAGGGGYFGSGKLTFDRSTFSGNTTSGNGSAATIYGERATLNTIVNSTFSGNSAVNGTIFIQESTLTILSTTVANNTASDGSAGIKRDGGVIRIGHTILSSDSSINCGGFMTSLGHNLSNGSNCSASFNANGVLNEVAIGIEALANNGGPTMTHALPDTSIAADLGDAATCSSTPINGVDQRGEPRPADENCDIGAFEFQVTPDITRPTSDASTIATPGFEDWYSESVTVNLTAEDDDSGVGQICNLYNGGTEPLCTDGASDSLVVDDRGVNTLEYWAVDLAGNEELPHKTLTIKLDLNAPTTTATPDREPTNGRYTAAVDIDRTALDGDSGVKQLCYALMVVEDGTTVANGCENASSLTVSLDAPGEFALLYWAEDQVGNTDAVSAQSLTLKLDFEGSTVSSSVDPTSTSGWANGPTSVTFTLESDGAPANELCYGATGDQPMDEFCSAYVEPVIVDIITAGETTITATGDDVSGQLDTEIVTVRIDTEDPTVAASFDREPVADGLFDAPIVVTLTGSDSGGSGVDQICYTLDSDSPTCITQVSLIEDSTDITISTSTLLRFWSVDAAGNESVLDERSITIDSAAPTAQATFSPDPPAGTWSKIGIQIELSGTDAETFIERVCYGFTGSRSRAIRCVDGSSTRIFMNTSGSSTLEYFVRDAAGHESAHLTRSLMVDNSRPTITDGPDFEIVSGLSLGDPLVARLALSWNGTDSVAPLAASDGQLLRSWSRCRAGLLASGRSIRRTGGRPGRVLVSSRPSRGRHPFRSSWERNTWSVSAYSMVPVTGVDGRPARRRQSKPSMMTLPCSPETGTSRSSRQPSVGVSSTAGARDRRWCTSSAVMRSRGSLHFVRQVDWPRSTSMTRPPQSSSICMQSV